MSPSVSVRLLLTQSDARLAEYARSGHERAFEALVHRYRRRLHAYCRRLLLSDERAEDALQQALLQAWMALRDGTEVRDVRPWLYRIVHNVAVNALRASGYDYCTLSESLSGADAPQADLDRRIAVREALAGLAALPPMQREALLRTAVEGRSHQQVASDLGLSEPALRGLVYRARATMRAAAGAIVPPPLLDWALEAGTRGAPALERLAAGGGGSAGLAGLLAKGGALAVTAGALAGGIVAAHSHRGAPAAADFASAREPHDSNPGAPRVAPRQPAAASVSVAPADRAPRGAGGRLAHRRNVANSAAPSGYRATPPPVPVHGHARGIVVHRAPPHSPNGAWQRSGSPQTQDGEGAHPPVNGERPPAAAGTEQVGGHSGTGREGPATGTGKSGGGVSASGTGGGEHSDNVRTDGGDQGSSPSGSSGTSGGEGGSGKDDGARQTTEAQGTAPSWGSGSPPRDERSIASVEPGRN
jgi:RNA polymerase sigma factor (sigma-70 family)